jgi:hypothetical protein
MTSGETEKTSGNDSRQIFLAALLERGWKLPTTSEEVAFTDNISLTDIEVPDSLKLASAVFEEIVKPRNRTPNATESIGGVVAENLALAAREGGQISESARKLMENDRAKFEEREVDGGSAKNK